jgi:hypothetical protein
MSDTRLNVVDCGLRDVRLYRSEVEESTTREMGRAVCR